MAFPQRRITAAARAEPGLSTGFDALKDRPAGALAQDWSALPYRSRGPFVFGILGGIGAELDRCCTCCAPPSGCSARASNGRCWPPAGTRGRWARIARCSAAMCASNAEPVVKIRRVLEGLSFPNATPAEARTRLANQGADRTQI